MPPSMLTPFCVFSSAVSSLMVSLMYAMVRSTSFSLSARFLQISHIRMFTSSSRCCFMACANFCTARILHRGAE